MNNLEEIKLLNFLNRLISHRTNFTVVYEDDNGKEQAKNAIHTLSETWTVSEEKKQLIQRVDKKQKHFSEVYFFRLDYRHIKMLAYSDNGSVIWSKD